MSRIFKISKPTSVGEPSRSRQENLFAVGAVCNRAYGLREPLEAVGAVCNRAYGLREPLETALLIHNVLQRLPLQIPF